MGMNSGLFDSPNGRHSGRSYQITRKKKSPHSYTIIRL